MKNLIIALSILTLVLLGIIFVGTMEMNDINRTQQVEIDFLRAKNIQEKDLLLKRLKVKDDSLNIAYQVIEQANKERIEAHERSQQTIRNLQKIIFITHNDSSRTAELRTLYKSYNP